MNTPPGFDSTGTFGEAGLVAKPRRLPGNSVWQMLARATSIAGQAAAFALVARLVDPVSFGSFAAAIALASIVGAASEFGIQNTAVVELARPTAQRLNIYRGALRASIASAILTLLTGATIAWIIFDGLALVSFFALMPWIVLSRLCTPGIAWWQSCFAFRRLCAAEAIGRGSPLVGLFVLTIWRPGSEADRLWLAGLVLAIGALIHLLAVLPRSELRSSDSRQKPGWHLLRAAAPLGIVSALSLIHVRIDQVLLELLDVGGAELADYAVAYRIIDGVSAVLGSVAIVGFTIMSRSSRMQRVDLSRATGRAAALAGLSGSLVVLLLAHPFVLVVGGAGYEGAVRFTRLLAAVIVFSVLTMVPSLTLVAERRVARIIAFTAVLVVASIALNLLLIPTLGPAGSVVASLSTEFAAVLGITLIAQRVLPGSQSVLLTVGVASTAILGSLGFEIGGIYPILGTSSLLIGIGIVGMLVLKSNIPRTRTTYEA